MKNISKMGLVLIGVLVVSIFLFASFSAFHHYFGATVKDPYPKPAVYYKIVQSEKFSPWFLFSGKCRAVDYVEVRPRVTGTIQEILFKEGMLVKKGDPLFTIDPRPFQAAVDKAQANLNSIISQEKLDSIELARTEKLLKTHAVAEKDFDQRVSTQEMRRADIEAAKAVLKSAQLDLDYAHITSPINGKISRAEITVGNLVETGSNAPILTTIVSTSSIYVDFDIDEQSYIATANKLGANESQPLPVEVTVDGPESDIYKGNVLYFDNKINPASGTIKVRALVDNPKNLLVSGEYVNVKMGSNTPQEAIIVPDEAVGTDQNKKFVYIIDNQNKVVYREVKLGRTIPEGHIIQSGLNAGEKIVVKGVQRVRSGVVVDAADIKDIQAKENDKNPKSGGVS